jgi:hypothetical protein
MARKAVVITACVVSSLVALFINPILGVIIGTVWGVYSMSPEEINDNSRELTMTILSAPVQIIEIVRPVV